MNLYTSFVIVALYFHNALCQFGMDQPTPQEVQPTVTPIVPTLSPAQMNLNARCALKCRTEVCYLADENDCRNFITCQRDELGNYHGILQLCAFGTMWAGLDRERRITCDIPENVQCKFRYCSGKEINENFAHHDGNCKTYWTCESKGPVPMCCQEGSYFDPQAKRCLPDVTNQCIDACPFKSDACLYNLQDSAFSHDGNCKTYWNCSDNNPHPVCCDGPGYGYDPAQGRCMDIGCMDTCPAEYLQDFCLKPGVTTYPIHDNSCRTFMRCNAIDGDERWCCPSEHIYNYANQTCDRIIPGMLPRSCDDSCPMSYKQECPIRPHPTDPARFISSFQGMEVEQPCAPGTLYDPASCGCAVQIKGAPDNSCNMEVDIIFDVPVMIRSGSQNNVEIIRIGLVENSTQLNGRNPWRFNGRLYNRIPFAQQPFSNVYISLIFMAEQFVSNPGEKQVLLSNCMNQDLGGPSLEIALQNGQVTTTMVTEGATSSNRPTEATVSVPYQPNVWYLLTTIYDGSKLSMALESEGSTLIDAKLLNGTIAAAAEGIDIGGCAINRNTASGYATGFVGSMAKLQFTKCLRQDWIKNFNAIAERP